MTPTTPAAKSSLRTLALARRKAAVAAHGPASAAGLARHGLAFLSPPPGAIVSGFSSLADELDARPLLARLHADGFRLALPVMQGKGRPLLFRAWAPGDQMRSAVWGILEPLPEQPEVRPDIVLTPLLAFDRAGWRLGYGGGYYDRTLRALRAEKPIIAVGLALAEQEVDAVPHLDYDERLDWVLTPDGPIACGG